MRSLILESAYSPENWAVKTEGSSTVKPYIILLWESLLKDSMRVRFSAGAPRIDCQLLKYLVSTTRVSPSQRAWAPVLYSCRENNSVPIIKRDSNESLFFVNRQNTDQSIGSSRTTAVVSKFPLPPPLPSEMAR